MGSQETVKPTHRFFQNLYIFSSVPLHRKSLTIIRKEKQISPLVVKSVMKNLPLMKI